MLNSNFGVETLEIHQNAKNSSREMVLKYLPESACDNVKRTMKSIVNFFWSNLILYWYTPSWTLHHHIIDVTRKSIVVSIV